MIRLRLCVAAVVLVGFSSAAQAECSPGFLADLACDMGIIDEETANTLDDWNDRLGNPVDEAIYTGMDYAYPGAGTFARQWPQIRDGLPRPGGPGPSGPGPMTGPPPANYPPPYYPGPQTPPHFAQRPASVCVTAQGMVPMMVPLPVGSSCYAATPYGNFPGVAQ